jgi:hypothetical protein
MWLRKVSPFLPLLPILKLPLGPGVSEKRGKIKFPRPLLHPLASRKKEKSEGNLSFRERA